MSNPIGRNPGIKPPVAQKADAPISAPRTDAPAVSAPVAKPAAKADAKPPVAPQQNAVGKQNAEQAQSRSVGHGQRSAALSPAFARFNTAVAASQAQATKAARFPEPTFAVVGPERTMAASGAAIAGYVGPQLKDHVTRLNYDSMALTNAFLAHLDDSAARDPKATPQQALASWKPTASEACDDYGGSHCVGLAQDFARQLQAQGVPAFVVAAELPAELRRQGGPAHGHAAAMIRFENPDDKADRGFVVLDPGLNLAKPIVVRPGQPGTLQTGKENWTFTLDEAAGTITAARARKDGGDERTTFLTSEWTNVDAALTARAPMNRNLKLVSRDEEGNVAAALVTDLDKKKIQLRIADQRVSIGFDEVAKLGDQLSDAVVTLLGSTREALMARVESIISHQDDLAALRPTKEPT